MLAYPAQATCPQVLHYDSWLPIKLLQVRQSSFAALQATAGQAMALMPQIGRRSHYKSKADGQEIYECRAAMTYHQVQKYLKRIGKAHADIVILCYGSAALPQINKLPTSLGIIRPHLRAATGRIMIAGQPVRREAAQTKQRRES